MIHYECCATKSQDLEESDQLRCIGDLEDILTESLKGVEVQEIKRVFGHICKTYTDLGEGMLNGLRELNDRGAVIRFICEKVGLENVLPLIKFQELLSVEGGENFDALSEVLLKHQANVLPSSIECTSPPGTPLPYFGEGVVLFFIQGNDQRFSPAVSPTGSQQLAFPTEVEQ